MTRSHGQRAARRHNRPRMSRIFSWLALAVTGVFAIIFFQQAGAFKSWTGTRAPVDSKKALPGQMAASSSTFTGFDKNQQPYKINAQSALQDEKDQNLVHLKKVSGQFRRTGGENLLLAANRALYDSDAKTLKLTGDVKLASQGRYTARMQEALVTVKSRQLVANVPVVVTFENGIIYANRLEITDGGKRILFSKRIKARFGGAGKKGNIKQ